MRRDDFGRRIEAPRCTHPPETSRWMRSAAAVHRDDVPQSAIDGNPPRYRSRTSRADFDREQHGMNWSFAARSSAVRQ